MKLGAIEISKDTSTTKGNEDAEKLVAIMTTQLQALLFLIDGIIIAGGKLRVIANQDMSFIIENQWIFAVTLTVLILRHEKKKMISTKLPKI